MKPSSKFLLALAFTLSVGVRAHSQDLTRGRLQAGASKTVPTAASVPAAPASSAVGHHREVTRYATELDGDHSLDAAIIAEQVFARFTLYTVRLQFASGAEQSIAVTAPPGGLQPEMRDMSGDSVPNDLVLTSRLLHAPLVVLLNDGHDHFTVAESSSLLGSSEDRASEPHQVHRASALVPSSFKARGLTDGGGLFLPQPQQNFLSPISQTVTKPVGYTSSSGRAPPASAAKI